VAQTCSHVGSCVLGLLRDLGDCRRCPSLADEGSTGIVMRKNLVFRRSSGGFHQHYGRANAIENNVFAMARGWQLQRSRVENHTSFRFEKNIVWWDSSTPQVKGDWMKQLVTKSNCYWNASGTIVFPDGQDLAARQAVPTLWPESCSRPR